MKSEQGVIRIENKPQETSLTLSNREKQIAKKIVEINSLVAFKYEAQEIMLWAADINRLMPVDDVKKIPFILDCFKMEKLEYDHKVGIQNFFRAVEKVIMKENGEYEILKAIW